MPVVLDPSRSKALEMGLSGDQQRRRESYHADRRRTSYSFSVAASLTSHRYATFIVDGTTPGEDWPRRSIPSCRKVYGALLTPRRFPAMPMPSPDMYGRRGTAVESSCRRPSIARWRAWPWPPQHRSDISAGAGRFHHHAVNGDQENRPPTWASGWPGAGKVICSGSDAVDQNNIRFVRNYDTGKASESGGKKTRCCLVPIPVESGAALARHAGCFALGAACASPNTMKYG